MPAGFAINKEAGAKEKRVQIGKNFVTLTIGLVLRSLRARIRRGSDLRGMTGPATREGPQQYFIASPTKPHHTMARKPPEQNRAGGSTGNYPKFNFGLGMNDLVTMIKGLSADTAAARVGDISTMADLLYRFDAAKKGAAEQGWPNLATV
ncbi:MAG: hypothetical protein V3S29_04835, partial [bacterium]